MVGPKALGNKKIKIKKGKKMAKFSTISKAASAAILGAVLLTGCGSSDTAAASGQSAINNADGYLGGNGRVLLKKKDGSIDSDDTNASADSKSKGKIKFKKTLVAGGKVIIKGGSGFYFDNNKNGTQESDEHNLSFDMKSEEGSSFASQFSTAAEDANNTAMKAEFKDLDPVATFTDAVENNTTKSLKLLKIAEILKAAYQEGATDIAGVTAILGNIENKLEDNVSLADVNGSTITNGANIDPSIAAKAESIIKTVELVQEVIKLNPDTKLDLDIVFAKVSDGGESDVLQAIADTVLDQNLTGEAVLDTNSTKIDSLRDDINTTISAANTAIDSLPAKLNFGSTVKLGTKEFYVTNNTFTGTISTDSNISDFYCIALPEVTYNKDFSATDANLTLEVSNGDDSLTLKITGAQITPNSVDGYATITLPADTNITASKTGLPTLTEISPSGTVSATIQNELKMDDLAFNVNTVLNELSNTTITSVMAKLDDYLKVENTYDVSLTLDTTLLTAYDTITGSITVSDDTTTETPDDEVIDDGTPTITLGTNALTVTAGETNSTTVTVSDDVVISQSDVVSSSDSIATVSYDDVHGNITVTGVSEGTATITVHANNSSETISVTVEAAEVATTTTLISSDIIGSTDQTAPYYVMAGDTMTGSFDNVTIEIESADIPTETSSDQGIGVTLLEDGAPLVSLTFNSQYTGKTVTINYGSLTKEITLGEFGSSTDLTMSN